MKITSIALYDNTLQKYYCLILDEKKMRSLKMGSLLSVSQGSKQPAKLVIIKYMPLKNKKPIVLVQHS